jgi:DNA-binding GntR family transcriptional regulator
LTDDASPEIEIDLPSVAAGRGNGRELRRGEVQDAVLAALRQGLMVGAFIPGQVMSLRKLAARLGTSPMPVREALSHLVAANVLEALPNRSVRVPRLSAEKLTEMTEVRVLIEGMATRTACANATPALIASLEKINQRLVDAIYRRDILQCLSCNQQFHFTVYAAAQSEILMPLIESLWLQSGPTTYFSLMSPEMPWDASEHEAIIAALGDGDARQAERCMTRDIRTTLKNLLKSSMLQPGNGPLSTPLDSFTFDLSPTSRSIGARS